MSATKRKCKDHDWKYDVVDLWYVMVTRECWDCGEIQETKAGLSNNDFQEIK